MASCPEFIGLATSSSQTLADTALVTLRDAVVIMDARATTIFPVVVANVAARSNLLEESDGFGLIESPFARSNWQRASRLYSINPDIVSACT